jgi:hypothetical protein
MKYITGIYALNLPCALETCGDWHTSALKWENVTLKDSKETLFKEWGIETGKVIPEHEGLYNVANHIRALLDLLIDGKFGTAQGMKEDFICNEKYTCEVMDKVWCMRNLFNWEQIDRFMEKEYLMTWVEYKKERINK